MQDDSNAPGDDERKLSAADLRGSTTYNDAMVGTFVDSIISKMMPAGEEISEISRQTLVAGVQHNLKQSYFINDTDRGKLSTLSGLFGGHLLSNFDKAVFDEEARNVFPQIFSALEEFDYRRMVPIDYMIKDTTMSHGYDLNSFKAAVEHVATEWNVHKDTGKYIAPYLCFIQSSGMGKTKIMYEFAKRVNMDDDCNISCDLVVSANVLLPAKDNVFASVLEFPNLNPNLEKEEASRRVYTYLNKVFLKNSDLRKKHPMKEIHSIMFDEAQFLLMTQYGEEAFLFRCIRVWLRAKRLNQTVVAVFTGTSSALHNNYNLTDDAKLEIKTSSRETDGDEYHKRGRETFPPFICTTTMGALWSSMQKGTEYERSIRYGRPLFAAMHKNDKLKTNIGTVLQRLLLTKKNHAAGWRHQELSWLSILATRVQMGSTTVSVTAELVAKGYANLMHIFEDKTATTFSCLPDPVCARLAMCMMDENWELQNKKSSNKFNGESKIWWVEKVKNLYSSGLCRPDKGDVGDVLVALYFLFCADECRQTDPNNKDYESFSIPLHQWMDRLIEKSDWLSKRSRRNPFNGSIDISFIQVCRNCLKYFGIAEKSWAPFADQEFLSHLYAAGSAFYMYPGCPLIDLAAPMRVTMGTEVLFGALLVSIKSRIYFSDQDSTDLCTKMVEKANMDKCRSTLCLVVVFGQEAMPKEPYQYTWNQDMMNNLVEGSNEGAVLLIPFNDKFRLTHVLNSLTSFGQQQLMESHSFVRALSKNSKGKMFIEKEESVDVAEFCYSKEERTESTQAKK